MSFAPYAVLWVALAVAVGLLAANRNRPRLTWAILLTIPVALLNLWLITRPTTAARTWGLAGRQWLIDDPAWQLTGLTLLLLLTAVVHLALNRPAGAERQPAWLLALAAATLPVIWAADARTRVMGLGLFTIVWLASLLFDGARTDTLDRRLRGAWPLLAALFSLWLAGALPALAMPCSLLAGALLLMTQPAGDQRGQPVALLRDGLPVILGAAALATALRAAVPSGVEVAAATTVGLLAVVTGLWRVWYDRLERLPAALRPALGGLALVAAVWAGAAALLPAARLAVFVPALLTVGETWRSGPWADSRARWAITPRTLAAVAAFLVVAGLPLTVGLALLGPLYETWLAAGGGALLAVSILLLSLWLATLWRAARRQGGEAAAGSAAWLRGAALLPPLAGLISLNPTAFAVRPVVWAAIALTAVAGGLLGRFAPAGETLGGLLREATTLPAPAAALGQRFRQAGRATADAVADALAILEGEYGLLWLLGLLLLLLWLA